MSLRFSLSMEIKNMKLYKGVHAVLISAVLLLGLSACAEKGPAEKAGEAIDNAASDVKESSEDAMDAIKKELDD